MTRSSFLLGALLALALGGLAYFGGLGEVRGGAPQDAEGGAVRPGAAQPAGSSEAGEPVAGPSLAPTGTRADTLAAASRSSGTETSAQGARESAASLAESTSGATQVPARLIGALRGPQGPVFGAHVRVLLDGTALDDAQSTEDGSFSLRTAHLDAGLILDVRARGFAPYQAKLRRLIPGESRNLGTLLLLQGRVLDVDVTDADGRPLKEASVLIESAGGGRGNAYRHEGVTAEHGRIRFSDVPLGPLRIQAKAEGNGSRVLEHHHDGGGRALRIALLPERKLTLLLRSAEGESIGGALVSLTASDRRHEIYELTADEDGRAAFEGLGSELFDARVVAKGFRTDTRRALAADGREVTLEMLPWPGIVARVQAPGGGELPAETLARALPNTSRATLLRADQSDHEAVPVGADGRVRLPDLRPGEYVVRVDAPGFAPTLSDPVRVKLDQDASIGPLFLQRGGSLEVRVREQGTSNEVAGARVELHASRPSPAALVNETPAFAAAVLLEAETDASGVARFEGLATGDFAVVIRAAGFQARLGGTAHVVEGGSAMLGPVDLVTGSTLRGRVRTPGGGPVAGAVVVLRGSRADAPVQLATDGNGDFASPPLAPGQWKVTVRTIGSIATTNSIERTVLLSPDEQPEALDLVLEP